MQKQRVEHDSIGEISISDDALYGIHSFRAKENFPNTIPFHIEWYKAMAVVKKSCYLTCIDFVIAFNNKYKGKQLAISLPSSEILNFLIDSATEMQQGKYFEHFIVPGVSGGAGTSINMNINEILANVSLLKAGHKPGEYKYIDPIEHANIFQSTNDVVPTALKVATMQLLNELEVSINKLRFQVEKKEEESRNYLRISYTQMQEAVPTSIGRMFGAYNNALSRDWWRVSKCAERIKTVNLGGSAIGSGITVPRYFIMEVVQKLHELTGLPVTRSEDMMDATSNLDSFVEIHATLKAHAVNLEKIASDLRLLASDIHKNREIQIPARQVGSSIMPGKVNPVIAEYVISCSHKVYANDMLISNLSGQGCLELNAYLPLIGHALLESLKLLISANQSLKTNMIEGITFNHEIALQGLLCSPSITTALVPLIGYNKASLLAKLMKEKQIDIYEANKQLAFINEEKIKQLLLPENLLKEGFSIDDILM